MKSKTRFWTWENYIYIYQCQCLEILAHFNLHRICKYWWIAHKLNHFFKFPFLFLVIFFAFIFPFCKGSRGTSHSSSHTFNSINNTSQKKIIMFTTWHTTKLFDRFKCELEMKTAEKQGIRAHSLVCSSLGVEGRAGVPGWD